MAPETITRRESRRYASSRAHAEAHPKHKRAAFDNGVTTRTERRWRTPSEAQGSPQEIYDRYLATAQDPWRLEAHNRATILQANLGSLTDRAIVARIHELNVDNAIVEGADNANRVRRGVSPADRATAHERDAAVEIELAALWRECAARGISEAEVFA